MTASPDGAFTLETGNGGTGEVCVRIDGDLDVDSADDLIEAARACLEADPSPRLLRLDCGKLTLCDSMGLAALLMIHRLATAAGARLRLDHRPELLERLLELTGTLDHFTDADGIAAAVRAPGEPDAQSTSGITPPVPPA
ncbi:STAS domain-containing protein [Streptomyces wuyuanensis]|uniref:Anti-anti-sigma factor n=1 Tax=Streptomyces wuyuanensis TaxID=1196353 RepID=A0A1G9TXM8_9ACTN|nr:STAS domain-containing protein [Streptomyces wuyuanensis]SDM52341.1 anti-anti-sigma factor [Streptomyces wuyuanensis]